MNPLPTSTTVAETFVDVVGSQAAELAKDVALPAAKFAAAHFLRTRAKGIVLALVLVTSIAVLVKRKKGNGSSEAHRPSTEGRQEAANSKEQV